MTSRKILFVDDEPALLDGIRRLLHRDFEIALARSGDEALRVLAEQGPFAVVCADMRMPGMSGVELLEKVATSHPDTVRLMLSGNADQSTAIEAINRGRIFSFLAKPATRETLAAAIEGALRLYALTVAEKELLERTLAGCAQTLVEILALARPEAFGRARKTVQAVRRFARTLGGDPWVLEMAALLAPIGWATMPSTLIDRLRTPAAMTQAENELVARVPEVSGRLIANIPRLETVGETVRFAGRPFEGETPSDGVTGQELPLNARILRLLTALVEESPGEEATAACLPRLVARLQEFDPWLLGILGEALKSSNGSHGKSDGVSELITEINVIDGLRSGDRLLVDLRLADGTLALAAATVLTDLMLEGIGNLGRAKSFRLPIKVSRTMLANVRRAA